MRIVYWLLLSLLVGSWAYWMLVWWCVRSFVRRPRAQANDLPSVSILKPIKGLDRDAYENFASICRLDYPNYEILFGIDDPADPAAEVARKIQADFPNRAIRMLLAPAGSRGGINPKSVVLDYLSRATAHEVLVISDSDIRVTPDYLRRVVAPLNDPSAGIVTCLYRSEPARSLPSIWEALYLNTTFVPSAILGSRIPGVHFCFGASIALRRADLLAAGGYAAIADYLADDYQVGLQIAGLGRRVVLSEHVVSQVLGRGRFRASWDRELRWARGIRVSSPMQYPGLLVTYATPIALLMLGAGIWSRSIGWGIGLGLLAATGAMRWIVADAMLRYLDRPQPMRDLAWLPLRDVMTAAAWCAGLFGRSIAWRGRRFSLLRGGKLEPASPTLESASPGGLLRRGIRALDRWLRHREGIFEFTDDPHCLFRLSIAQAEFDLTLADGTPIVRGQPVLEVHLWNEHMMPARGKDAGVKWAVAMMGRAQRSWIHLAQWLQTPHGPEIDAIRVFHVRANFMPRKGLRQLEHLMRKAGMERIEPPNPPRWSQRVHVFLENILIMLLIWTFNPGAGGRSRWMRERHDYWVSREALVHRYGMKSLETAEPADAR